MIVRWETTASKSGPCSMCSSFADYHWHIEDIPQPPLHPNCGCILVPVDEIDIDLSTIRYQLTDLSPAARQAFVRLTTYYLVTHWSLPSVLHQFVEEAMKKLENSATCLGRATFAADGELRAVLVEPGRVRTINNLPGRHTFTAEALTDAFNRGLFRGIACNIDHSQNHPSVRDVLGVWTDATNENGRITASLSTFVTDETRPIIDLLEQIRNTPPDLRPDIGISLVLYPGSVSNSGEIQSIQAIESADLVLFPAVPAARFQFTGESNMNQQNNAGEATKWPQQPDPQWDAAYRQTAAAAVIDMSDLPALVKTRLKASTYTTPADLDIAIENARAELAALHADGVINLPGRPRIQVRDPLDEAAEIAAFIFGAQGATVPANIRRVDEWYKALTGDVNFRGVFDADRVQFAGATTTTLSDLAVNAMNKVIVEQMANLGAWRWYERITGVEPNDGSLHPMKWITFGGIGNLPTVAEGAAYTELTVGDVSEADSFTKYGGYVGITREILKNSDIGKMQAIPRALAVAAVRSRSAAVSNIFTQASGTGPTLEQDSTVLFHSNHSNVATTALGTDATAWRAARTECFKHTDVNSGKRLAIYPRFLLVPADLYDTALSILGYGEGMPTAYTPEAESRGFADPRPIPLVVPDWTDATDWAYIVDPAVFPVIQMSYSQSPGGRSHPAPELFAVTSSTSGLIFSNDTLPIKVRDEFAVGVNGPRGIGKRNVA